MEPDPAAAPPSGVQHSDSKSAIVVRPEPEPSTPSYASNTEATLDFKSKRPAFITITLPGSSPSPRQEGDPNVADINQVSDAQSREESQKRVAAAKLDFKSRRPSFISVAIPSPRMVPSSEVTKTPKQSIGPELESDDDDDPTTPPMFKRHGALASHFGRVKARLADQPSMAPAIKSVLKKRQGFQLPGDDQPQNGSRPDSGKPPFSSSFDDERDSVYSDYYSDDSASQDAWSRKDGNWLFWSQWIALWFLIAMLACSLKIRKAKDVIFLGLHLWRWFALTLVIFSGRLISGWVVTLLVVLIERRCLMKQRVLYFVYGLRDSVRNCIWLALALAVWQVVFSSHGDTKVVQIISKVLWCLFAICVAWMFKVLLVKTAASNFHRSAYFDRIQDCIFNQHLLETFSAPPTLGDGLDTGSSQVIKSGDNYRKGSEFAENSKVQVSNIDIEAAQPGQQKFNKTWRTSLSQIPFFQASPKQPDFPNPSTPGRTPRTPGTLRSSCPIEQEKLQQLTAETVSSSTLGQLMKKIRNTNMTTCSSMLSNSGTEISSENEARSAAKQIFHNIARPGQKHLAFKDFLYFLPEDQAARAFSLFEISEDGTISKKSLIKWVVNVFKERRALALTLSDSQTVVAKLHRVFDVVVGCFLFIICLLILGVDTSKLLVFFSSIFIPLVFVFGNTARGVFEALVFMFVQHPYDVGDKIAVDGQALIVEEMNVLNTIFLTGSNEKVYYPNSLLANKVISNFHRSPDQWDSIEFQIHISTPIEKLGALKDRIQKYIENLPQFWYPSFCIICKEIEDNNKMKMAMSMQHHLNFQEGGERFKRRSNLLLFMKQQLEDLGIMYQLPSQEITVKGVPVLNESMTHYCI